MSSGSASPASGARPAGAADAAFLASLVPAFVDFGLPSLRDPEAVAAAFARDLADALRDGAELHVAEDDTGQRLGFVHLREVADLEGCRRAHVSDLAVAPGAQGVGVGRELMAFAEAWAAERGHGHVGLSAFVTNRRAVRFYERLGFEADTVTMRKRIDGRPR